MMVHIARTLPAWQEVWLNTETILRLESHVYDPSCPAGTMIVQATGRVTVTDTSPGLVALDINRQLRRQQVEIARQLAETDE